MIVEKKLESLADHEKGKCQSCIEQFPIPNHLKKREKAFSHPVKLPICQFFFCPFSKMNICLENIGK